MFPKRLLKSSSFGLGSLRQELASSLLTLLGISHLPLPLQTGIQTQRKRAAAASCMKLIEAGKLTEMMTTLNQTSHFPICEEGWDLQTSGSQEVGAMLLN